MTTRDSAGAGQEPVRARLRGVASRTAAVAVSAVLVVWGWQGGDRVVAATAVTVAGDGSGDYATVQQAVDAAPSGQAFTIAVKPGRYHEKVTIPAAKGPITLAGTGTASATTIEFDAWNGGKKPDGGTWGTSGSASVTVNSDAFTARNITFANTFDESTTEAAGKQAVALLLTGDRAHLEDVRLLGNQDTLYLNGGRAYLHGCYVEGDVDFIFGRSAAVLDGCTIHSLARESGVVTAASTPGPPAHGFLLVNCDLTGAAAAGSVHLGRPWPAGGDTSVKPQVVVRDSTLGAHIKSAPWTDMSGFSWKDARFAEYRNSGPGAGESGSDRPQLTDTEAASATVMDFLGDWSPTR